MIYRLVKDLVPSGVPSSTSRKQGEEIRIRQAERRMLLYCSFGLGLRAKEMATLKSSGRIGRCWKASTSTVR